MVFLSGDPSDHHQLIMFRGRTAKPEDIHFAHVAFRVRDMDSLRALAKRLAKETDVTEVRTCTHGNAWSIYFKDPSGNFLSSNGTLYARQGDGTFPAGYVPGPDTRNTFSVLPRSSVHLGRVFQGATPGYTSLSTLTLEGVNLPPMSGLTLVVDKIAFDFRYWDTDISDAGGFCHGPTFQCDSTFVFSTKITLP